MADKFIPYKVIEDMIPSTRTGNEVYFTNEGNLYSVVDVDKSLLKMTDIYPVNALPTSPKVSKAYFLSTNHSINLWDGTAWHSYGAVNFTLQPPTNTALGGVKSGGSGVTIDTSGLISVKNGVGLKFDANGNLIPDEPSIDVTQLKNYSMLSLGSPKGFFDSSATLATFADAQKGSFWIYNGATTFTLGGVSVNSGDQIWCKTTITGSPADLSTNFVKVPYTLVQATTTTAGAVKLGSATPLMDSSTASIGTSDAMARQDHVHPTDTTRMTKLATTTVNAIPVFNNTTGDLRDSTKTLPTGTIVGDTDTQTLTNKALSDSTTVIKNVTDSTKGIKFDTVGNTTGVVGTVASKFTTPKTITLPDVTGTLMIAPEVTELKIFENKNLVENMIYEVTSTAIAGSVYTLPTSASRTGAFIDFYIAVGGFSDTTKFIVRGSNINGSSNDVICNRSYTYFRFVYSAILSEWILVNSNNGY